MATSIRSSLKPGDAGSRAFIVLLVALVTLHQLTVVSGSSADNFVVASDEQDNGSAAKLSPSSSSSSLSSVADGTTAASSSIKPSKTLSNSELDPDVPVSSTSSADRKEIMDNRVRTKRNWKTNRVQAAWGKRASGNGGFDEVLSSLVRVPDTRLRRKWTHMGRQAWGKRSFDSATTGHLSGETPQVKSDGTDDSSDSDDVEMSEQPDYRSGLATMNELIIPGRFTRKWGVGSAKAAWGKRKWGASNDMRVWGKRSVADGEVGAGDDGDTGDSIVEEKDDIAELQQGSRLSRSRRSAIDGGEVTRQRLRGDPWFQRGAVEAVAAKRLRMSGVSPAMMGSGRVYVGPKRNWQTNTMKVWGKRSDYSENNDDSDDEGSFYEYAFDDDTEGRHPQDGNAWNGVSDEREVAARKRAWSGDNSLRVWGKRYLAAAAAAAENAQSFPFRDDAPY